MKRLIFILSVMLSTYCIHAEEQVRVITNDAMVVDGVFIDGTDSLYTIRCTDSDMRNYIINHYGSDTISFKLSDIYEVHMYGKVFSLTNGKLVAKTEVKREEKKTKISKSSDRPTTYNLKPHNPNYVVGKSLVAVSNVSIGVGVPCLVSGTVLMILGYTGNMGTADQIIAKSKSAAAGQVLLPIGASLTIIGIPLRVHGKKIMEIDINYTGNGAGVALQF